jgi:hypothetical protein
MLNENKNIDQLFQKKLEDYEKTPPMFVWTNIQGMLNTHRKERRIFLLKTVGIAAAVLIAFLAGWQLSNSSDKNMYQNIVASQKQTDQNTHPVTKKNIPTNQIAVYTDQNRSKSSTPVRKTNPISSKLSSLATFAASPSIFSNTDTLLRKSGELELLSSEKEFLDELHHNFKIVKKLADWFADSKKDTVTTQVSQLKDVNANAYTPKSYETPMTAVPYIPARNNSGRWSLKAEFAPVFNNQTPNSSSQYSNYQKTNAENTFSGGMVAGYKVGKRLMIKSGIVYSKIRQTTRNLDLISSNPIYNVSTNISRASTPAGPVNLDKIENKQYADAYFGGLLNSGMNNSIPTANTELRQDIAFIEIPVMATYKLIDKKITIGLTGGISSNILVGNSAILSNNGTGISSGETANMRNTVYSSAVGVEIGYEITNRITLTVEPRAKYFINSLSTNKTVIFKPSQVSIATGLTYSFN